MFNTYGDISQRDVSGRMDEYALPLTSSPEDMVIGRYGERMIPLNFGISVARRFSNKGASSIGLNIDPIRRAAPLFGDITAGISEFGYNKFTNTGFGAKVAGAASQGVETISGGKISAKFLTKNMVSNSPSYEGLYSGMNLLWNSNPGASTAKVPGMIGSKLSQAKKFLNNGSKTSMAVGAVGSYALGGLVGKSLGSIAGLDSEDLDRAESVGNLVGTSGYVGSQITRSLGRKARYKTLTGLRDKQLYGSVLKHAAEQVGDTGIGKRVAGVASGAIANVKSSDSIRRFGKSISLDRSRRLKTLQGLRSKQVYGSSLRAGAGQVMETAGSKAFGKVLGFGLAAANVAAYVDMPLAIAETISDIYTHSQMEYITGYEQRQVDRMNAPSNVKKINRNLNFADSNERELDYLLTQPNLARDAAYRYRDSNFGV